MTKDMNGSKTQKKEITKQHSDVHEYSKHESGYDLRYWTFDSQEGYWRHLTDSELKNRDRFTPGESRP